MTEQTRIDFDYDREKFEEMRDFVDNFSSTSSENKTDTARYLFNIAYQHIEEIKRERKQIAQQFRELKKEMEEVIEDDE